MKKWFIVPPMLWIVAFTIFPLLYSLVLSFGSMRVGNQYRWIGLSNYVRILQDSRWWNSLRFMLELVVIAIVLEVSIGTIMALLLDQKMRGRSFLRGLWVLPIFATPVAVAYLARTIFNEDTGPINALLSSIGIGKAPWLSDPRLALVSVVTLDIWQWTPFVFIIVLAGLQSIPQEVIEAAKVDGASSFHILSMITMPLLGTTLLTALFLRLVEVFKIFDYPFGLTGGGPGVSTESPSILVYKTALRSFDFGYGSSLAYAYFIVIIIVCSLILKRVRNVFFQ